jgi:endo-1,4-beta-xylanase
MRRSAFFFGSAVSARLLNTASPDADRYRWIIERYFNKAVFENDLKWPPLEAARSKTGPTYRRQWTDAALAWLAERGIWVRGHYVSWAPLYSADGLGPGMGPLSNLHERLLPTSRTNCPP